jgi:hypothetical protein
MHIITFGESEADFGESEADWQPMTATCMEHATSSSVIV